MSKTINMDRAGRVVIPKMVRERYGLAEGSGELELTETPEGIVLRPVSAEIPVRRHESGWVIFCSGEEETVEMVDPTRAIEEERERRHGRLRGPSGEQ